MRYNKEEKEVREQSSIHYFPPGAAGEMPRSFTEHYTHMFIQDLSRALLPARATRRGSKVSVQLLPENSDVNRKLIKALDLTRQGHYHRDLDRALSEFLRLTMVELCLDRSAVFEIVYLRPTPEAPRNGFDLMLLNSNQIFRRLGRWYQNIPTDIARERKVAERIRLPSQNIFVFTLSPHLARTVTSVRQALRELSDQSWHNLAMESQNGRLPYDFSVHQRSMGLALGETLRGIGWMARGSFNDKVTSYYSLRQDLRFKLFALEVREELVAQLNALLRRVGGELNWSTQVSITGMPTRANLDQALGEIASGERSFAEIMNAFRDL